MAKRTDIFKPVKYGSFVKDGKLFDFSPEHILVMAPWPDPRAWVKTSGTGFRVTRKHADEFFRHALFAKDHLAPKPTILSSGQRLLFPEDDYISFYEQVGRYYELRRAPYFDAMPDEVRNDLLRYSGRRWHLLSLFARCPGALDLSRSNPGLCYALASNWVFHRPAVKQPVRAARALVMRKQKQILEWLGFPGTEPARRILAKIMPKALGVASLLYLRDTLRDPEVLKYLAHLDHINAAGLRLVTDPRLRGRITPRLLADIVHDPTQNVPKPPVVGFFFDTLRMAGMLEWRHCPTRFSSLRRLMEVHDDLTRQLPAARLVDRWRGDPLPARFPSPPFAGTKHIRPILTPGDLYREGEAMQHCVGTYARDVAEGNYYIYRVLAPVRATLSLRSHWEGKWQPDQLYQSRNRPVETEMTAQIFQEVLQSGEYIPPMDGTAAEESEGMDEEGVGTQMSLMGLES